MIARMLAKEPDERFPRLADALAAAGLARPEARSGPVGEGAGAGVGLIDVDAEEPEPEEDAFPEPQGPDPLEPDPRAPDPAEAGSGGGGAGFPSATEVVSPPPPESRSAPRRPEPPVASEPSTPDAPSPSPHREPPAWSETDEEPAGEGFAWNRRGVLVGAGALLLILVVWGISTMGSGAVVGLVLSADSLALGGAGEERIVRLDGVDAGGEAVALEGVEWSSEDPSVASVEPAGASDARIAGVAGGSTWVLAKAGGLETRLWVRVEGPERIAGGGGGDGETEGGSGDGGGESGDGDPPSGGGDGSVTPPVTPTRVTLSVEGSMELEVGQRTTVRAAAPPGSSIRWMVDDGALVRVSGTGGEAVVEGLAPGRTTLRARVGTVEDSAPVEVRAEAVAAVAVEPETVELEPGGRSTLTATVRGVRSARLDRAVEWISRRPEVASVGPGGVVESRADGGTWIVARAGGVADSARVVVLPATSVTGTSVGFVADDGRVRMAADFRVEPRSATVCVEGSLRFDGGEWVSLGRQTLEAGPGAARGLFERAYEDLGLPTVGNARRRVDPRAQVWTGACDGPAAGEPVQVIEAPPVCLVRFLARDWEAEDGG